VKNSEVAEKWKRRKIDRDTKAIQTAVVFLLSDDWAENCFPISQKTTHVCIINTGQ
jgi:hypothetical protein